MSRKKEIFGWCLFDVANSSYTTVIITVFFSRIFSEVIVGPDEGTSDQFLTGNLYWSIALGLSWFSAAMLGPFFGAWADNSSHRKRLLYVSVAICSIFSFAMYFIPIGWAWFAALLLILSNIGFCLSENFIASFLPHIASDDDIGKISGWGWGIGYIGGILSIAICQFVVVGDAKFIAEDYGRLQLVGPMTAVFFVAFALPTFFYVREPTSSPSADQKSIVTLAREAYLELFSTFRKIAAYKDLGIFLISLFFSSGGLAIVISFTSIYAAQVVGIEGSFLVMYFIILNVAAAIGAVAFGYIQDKIGNLLSVNITLVIWVVGILMIYFLENITAMIGAEDIRNVFLIVGILPGICLGATQAASRALVGIFSPAKHSAEFFGFWGFSAKLAGVFAIVGFGAMQKIFELEAGLLLCSLFFVIALGINQFVNEKRGRAAAKES